MLHIFVFIFVSDFPEKWISSFPLCVFFELELIETNLLLNFQRDICLSLLRGTLQLQLWEEFWILERNFPHFCVVAFSMILNFQYLRVAKLRSNSNKLKAKKKRLVGSKHCPCWKIFSLARKLFLKRFYQSVANTQKKTWRTRKATMTIMPRNCFQRISKLRLLKKLSQVLKSSIDFFHSFLLKT